MPVVSEFNGIVIMMHYEKGERHHTPHFHVLYGSNEAVVTLNGEIMEGYLPGRQACLVRKWALIHYNELAANWYLTLIHRELIQIDPLKKRK